jgi:hypothetical protein
MVPTSAGKKDFITISSRDLHLHGTRASLAFAGSVSSAGWPVAPHGIFRPGEKLGGGLDQSSRRRKPG